MPGLRRQLLMRAGAAILLVLVATSGEAQLDDGRGEVSERVVKLTHQSAADAVGLVYPLLSGQGTVELRPGENTLVVRDQEPSIGRILARLKEFDRPSSAVRIAVQIISAGTRKGGDVRRPDLSPELLSRLRELLRYPDYSLLGQGEQEVREGQDTVFEVGKDYQVHFRLGRFNSGRRLGLEGFRILRRDLSGELQPLIHTNLNLNRDKPMVLGLAKTEASDRALMVVLDCLDPEMRTARK